MTAQQTKLLTWEQLRELQLIPTPSVANAIESFNVRPRNEGVSDGSVRPQFPELGPLVGYAVTVKVRSNERPPEGHSVNRWHVIEHLLTLPLPRIVVVQDLDPQSRRLGAMWGEVQSNTFKRLGCVGTITDGPVRDLDEVRALGFQLFSSRVVPSHAYIHYIAVGEPVTIAGLEIHSGDLLHGDQHGFITVPPEIAGQLPEAARRVEAHERNIIAKLYAPDFKPEDLRQ
ncbi:MAG: RraA family protein [Dehalococcoidia bacterium]